MKDYYLQNIIDALIGSGVDIAKQREFLSSVHNLKDEDIKTISELFSNWPVFVRFFISNYIKKIDVLEKKESEKWNEILEEERDFLEKFIAMKEDLSEL